MQVDHVIEHQVFKTALEVAMRDLTLPDLSELAARSAFAFMSQISEADDNLVPTHRDINMTKGASTIRTFCNRWRQVRQRWQGSAGT